MPGMTRHLAVHTGAQTTTATRGTIHPSRSFRVRYLAENSENYDAKGIPLPSQSIRDQVNAANTSVRSLLWSNPPSLRAQTAH